MYCITKKHLGLYPELEQYAPKTRSLDFTIYIHKLLFHMARVFVLQI